ncbi:MAG TPA: enoyl-CoA hydratase/isomerase family protein [Thermoanaerobaculia bacterium]|nr:enoyl-CoA hydratase/isomerase family protein [Thermoanaerobaculia bacterium]
MSGLSTVRIVRDGPVARVTLARPKTRNAFDEVVIDELTRAFLSFVDDRDTRVVVLEGEGSVFCAGADIGWMRRAGSWSKTENETDAERMAGMLRAIDDCAQPVVALVQGAAIGGGVGLVAASDVAIAAQDAVFSLAEVRLGILPSVISPYVLRAIGAREARRWFLTGERFGAAEAFRIGLVHEVVPAADLGAARDRLVTELLSSAPEAVAVAKRLIADVAGMSPEDAMPLTVRTIAERRASEEAKEGLTAFLEKRPPAWAPRKPVR